MYVAVEGIIGAGKSTLAQHLAKRMDWRMLAEPIDGNPLLGKFYEDSARWAFTMQIRMLHDRYRLQQVAAHDHQPCVLDRSLPGDRVFAKLQVDYGNMHPLEWETYERCYYAMSAIRPPMVMVYLRVNPDVAMQRMVTRARDVERHLPVEYLRDLARGYDDLIAQIESGKHAWGRGISVLTVNWDKQITGRDYVDTLDALVPQLTAAMEGRV
jgi:deoxyadenosine/deoxycytidine kinase